MNATKLKVNGTEYKIHSMAVMSQLPNTAQMVSSITYLEGKRGAVHILYERSNGTRWITGLSGANKNVTSFEKVA